MISFIKGIIDHIDDKHVVIEQSGIGFQALVPASVLSRASQGAEIKLLTYLQVKEDGMTLFGFLTQAERSIFLQLLSVSGIGPKSALSLLSALTPEQIMLAVVTDDLKALSRAQGIGAKAAGRIALELKSKMRAAGEAEGTGISPQIGFQLTTGPKQDAIDALTSLGYNRGEAVRAVMEVYVPELNTEQIIKFALKKLN